MDQEITQEQDRSSWPNDEREEDTDGGDPEEDPALSEEERWHANVPAMKPAAGEPKRRSKKG